MQPKPEPKRIFPSLTKPVAMSRGYVLTLMGSTAAFGVALGVYPQGQFFSLPFIVLSATLFVLGPKWFPLIRE